MKWAKKQGVSKRTLDAMFQYPHGPSAAHGIIRHDPGHDDHMHVRVRCTNHDAARGRCSDVNAAHRKGGAWRSFIRCPKLRRIVLPAPPR